MTDLIATVGQKTTERWLAGIVLPELLYVAIAGWALLAGHAGRRAYGLDKPDGVGQRILPSSTLSTDPPTETLTRQFERSVTTESTLPP